MDVSDEIDAGDEYRDDDWNNLVERYFAQDDISEDLQSLLLKKARDWIDVGNVAREFFNDLEIAFGDPVRVEDDSMVDDVLKAVTAAAFNCAIRPIASMLGVEADYLAAMVYGNIDAGDPADGIGPEGLMAAIASTRKSIEEDNSQEGDRNDLA